MFSLTPRLAFALLLAQSIDKRPFFIRNSGFAAAADDDDVAKNEYLFGYSC